MLLLAVHGEVGDDREHAVLALGLAGPPDRQRDPGLELALRVLEVLVGAREHVVGLPPEEPAFAGLLEAGVQELLLVSAADRDLLAADLPGEAFVLLRVAAHVL